MTSDILAVDFGTSNSAAAVLDAGRPRRIPVEAGADTLPTAVFFPPRGGAMRIGESAGEALILRDLGVLAHYVGDGSQPHHTTIHYNGWGDYPNPEGFTNSRQTHGVFEGAFTARVARLDTVEAAMPAAQGGAFDVKARTVGYLKTTLATVKPHLY